MEGLMRDHREYERKPKVRPARRAGLGWAEGPHNVETLDRSMTTPISATLAITSHQGPLRKQVTRALAWCLERGEAAAGGGGGGGGGRGYGGGGGGGRGYGGGGGGGGGRGYGDRY